MSRRLLRTGALALALGAAAAGLAACEPPPERLQLTINGGNSNALPDTDPGDGICADANGVCTYHAAVDEGNAHGHADIYLPSGLNSPSYGENDERIITVTGDLRFLTTGDFLGLSGTLVIETGGHLRVDDFSGGFPPYDLPLNLIVKGRLTASDAMIPSLDVREGGTAVLMRSLVTVDPLFGNSIDAWVRNAGTLTAVYSSFVDSIETTGPGSTHLVASLMRAKCTGNVPVSGGHNSGDAESCGLDQPSDISTMHMDFWGEALDYELDAEGIGIDHIPVGTLGCGLSNPPAAEPYMIATDDSVDPDGVPGCEPGYVQGPWGIRG